MFRYDSAFSNFIRKLMQLFAAGFLWLLLSFPLITIGAASISLCEYCIKLSKNEEGYLLSSFINSFKRNLKQGIQFWIPSLVLLVLFIGDYVYYGNIVLVFFCAWILLCSYITFTMAKFENTLSGHIRVALLLIVRNLPCASLVLLINVGFLALVYLSGYLLLVPIIGPAFFLQTVVFELLFDSQLRKGGIVQSE